MEAVPSNHGLSKLQESESSKCEEGNKAISVGMRLQLESSLGVCVRGRNISLVQFYVSSSRLKAAFLGFVRNAPPLKNAIICIGIASLGI